LRNGFGAEHGCGGHEASAQNVAAIDCVSHVMLHSFRFVKDA
jgi:hypothetical protein